MKEYIPIERYRIVLRHEMITGDDEVIPIGKPVAIECCVPHDPMFNGSLIINDMMDRLKDGLLQKFEKESE